MQPSNWQRLPPPCLEQKGGLSVTPLQVPLMHRGQASVPVHIAPLRAFRVHPGIVQRMPPPCPMQKSVVPLALLMQS